MMATFCKHHSRNKVSWHSGRQTRSSLARLPGMIRGRDPVHGVERKGSGRSVDCLESTLYVTHLVAAETSDSASFFSVFYFFFSNQPPDFDTKASAGYIIRTPV
jgi:hypothetical protein